MPIKLGVKENTVYNRASCPHTLYSLLPTPMNSCPLVCDLWVTLVREITSPLYQTQLCAQSTDSWGHRKLAICHFQLSNKEPCPRAKIKMKKSYAQTLSLKSHHNVKKAKLTWDDSNNNAEAPQQSPLTTIIIISSMFLTLNGGVVVEGKVPFWVEFACSPHVIVGSFQVLWFPPNIQRLLEECLVRCEWLSVSICQTCDRLVTCPRCTPPLTQWQLRESPALPQCLRGQAVGIMDGWAINKYYNTIHSFLLNILFCSPRTAYKGTRKNMIYRKNVSNADTLSCLLSKKERHIRLWLKVKVLNQTDFLRNPVIYHRGRK